MCKDPCTRIDVSSFTDRHNRKTLTTENFQPASLNSLNRSPCFPSLPSYSSHSRQSEHLKHGSNHTAPADGAALRSQSGLSLLLWPHLLAPCPNPTALRHTSCLWLPQTHRDPSAWAAPPDLGGPAPAIRFLIGCPNPLRQMLPSPLPRFTFFTAHSSNCKHHLITCWIASSASVESKFHYSKNLVSLVLCTSPRRHTPVVGGQ